MNDRPSKHGATWIFKYVKYQTKALNLSESFSRIKVINMYVFLGRFFIKQNLSWAFLVKRVLEALLNFSACTE